MATQISISPQIRDLLNGPIPFTVGTCDAEGTPNVTHMSQLFYVNEHHVAISCQFMNKTLRNLQSNPILTAIITDPYTMSIWKLTLEYLEEKQEGPVFEEMEMQLLALATPAHIRFSLQSALIFKLVAYELVFDSSKIQ